MWKLWLLPICRDSLTTITSEHCWFWSSNLTSTAPPGGLTYWRFKFPPPSGCCIQNENSSERKKVKKKLRRTTTKPVRHDIYVVCSLFFLQPKHIFRFLHCFSPPSSIWTISWQSKAWNQLYSLDSFFFSSFSSTRLIPNSSNDHFFSSPLFLLLVQHSVVCCYFVLFQLLSASSIFFSFVFFSFTFFFLSLLHQHHHPYTWASEHNTMCRIGEREGDEELEKTIYSNTINSVTTWMLFLIQLRRPFSVLCSLEAENLSQLWNFVFSWKYLRLQIFILSSLFFFFLRQWMLPRTCKASQHIGSQNQHATDGSSERRTLHKTVEKKKKVKSLLLLTSFPHSRCSFFLLHRMHFKNT